MSYLELVAAVATVVVPLVGLQTFWIARSLDRLDRRLDRMEDKVLDEHAQRIARLEERVS